MKPERSANKRQTPPRHLSSSARAWFREVLEGWDCDQHHVRLLILACEAWDRAAAARAALAKHGTTYTDRFGQPRCRPEVAIERDARTAFARLVRELNLDSEAPAETRPPRLRGR